jgi:hypothetical protein
MALEAAPARSLSFIAVLAAVALLCGPAEAAGAQASAGSSRQALFTRMMAAPADVDVALQYAAISALEGDLEGAVSTLERLLIFAPHVARLNFELGVLYYKLGAFDAATGYFNAAIASGDATADIKAQSAAYIAAAAHNTAADITTASAMLGARYQSNANGGVASGIVHLNGIEFTLNNAAMADPDANAFASFSGHLSHDLASQGDKFDADLALYASLYDKHYELNTAAGEVDFGPVFNLERFSLAHTRQQFYGILGAVSLKGDPYLHTAGIGTVVIHNFDPGTQGDVRLEYRYEDYQNSDFRPSVSDMTGGRTRLSGDLRRQINDRVIAYGQLFGERKDAAAGDQANWQIGGLVGTTIRINPPVANAAGPWSLDVQLGLESRNYDAPDPMISTSPRHDDEIFAQGALTVPLAPSWAAVGTLGYRKVSSSYDLYSYDDVSTSLAIMKSF